MPIININVVDGPDIQADDSRRGTIEFTFDDARVISRTVRAKDALSWANLLLDLPDEVEANEQLKDAEAASETDNEIAAVKQADIAQVALAYLRRAYSLVDPYRAYIKFDKFNDFRVAQGWSINQVVTGLTDVGLTQDEWDLMSARYAYLSNVQRVAVIQDYQLILNGDTWVDR